MLAVSFIVPVYKVPLEYLRTCLNSLIAQTMQECEFILVSDGAPEAECSICEEYATKDSRFKFFKQKHAGVSAARNYGIEQSQGDYIIFVDSDDQVDKALCSSIYSRAKKWDSDIILFEYSHKNKSKIFSHSIYNTDIPGITSSERNHLINEVCFATKNYSLILLGVCCKAYKRTFLNKNKLTFDTRFCYSEDQFFCLNTLLKTKKISYIASALYQQNYRIDSASFSYKENYEKEVFCYLDSFKKVIEQNNLSSNFTYNRAIQCILYTLDKCIFRPAPNLTISMRKKLFNDFLNYSICKDSLRLFDKNKFKFSERCLCFLCKYRLFFPLLLISKKWHWDRKRQIQHNPA
ncbi:MAG: glycosyltransferase family 2 protein [Fibrobacter sp.]|nr:glycosyltransferase family 2 protein [Fibrobacter sp.]